MSSSGAAIGASLRSILQSPEYKSFASHSKQDVSALLPTQEAVEGVAVARATLAHRGFAAADGGTEGELNNHGETTDSSTHSDPLGSSAASAGASKAGASLNRTRLGSASSSSSSSSSLSVAAAASGSGPAPDAAASGTSAPNSNRCASNAAQSPALGAASASKVIAEAKLPPKKHKFKSETHRIWIKPKRRRKKHKEPRGGDGAVQQQPQDVAAAEERADLTSSLLSPALPAAADGVTCTTINDEDLFDAEPSDSSVGSSRSSQQQHNTGSSGDESEDDDDDDDDDHDGDDGDDDAELQHNCIATRFPHNLFLAVQQPNPIVVAPAAVAVADGGGIAKTRPKRPCAGNADKTVPELKSLKVYQPAAGSGATPSSASSSSSSSSSSSPAPGVAASSESGWIDMRQLINDQVGHGFLMPRRDFDATFLPSLGLRHDGPKDSFRGNTDHEALRERTSIITAMEELLEIVEVGEHAGVPVLLSDPTVKEFVRMKPDLTTVSQGTWNYLESYKPASQPSSIDFRAHQKLLALLLKSKGVGRPGFQNVYSREIEDPGHTCNGERGAFARYPEHVLKSTASHALTKKPAIKKDDIASPPYAGIITTNACADGEDEAINDLMAKHNKNGGLRRQDIPRHAAALVPASLSSAVSSSSARGPYPPFHPSAGANDYDFDFASPASAKLRRARAAASSSSSAASGEEQSIKMVVLSWTLRSTCAYMNDPHGMEGKEANMQAAHVLLGGIWPAIVLIALRDIAADEELLFEYSPVSGEYFASRFRNELEAGAASQAASTSDVATGATDSQPGGSGANNVVAPSSGAGAAAAAASPWSPQRLLTDAMASATSASNSSSIRPSMISRDTAHGSISTRARMSGKVIIDLVDDDDDGEVPASAGSAGIAPNASASAGSSDENDDDDDDDDEVMVVELANGNAADDSGIHNHASSSPTIGHQSAAVLGKRRRDSPPSRHAGTAASDATDATATGSSRGRSGTATSHSGSGDTPLSQSDSDASMTEDEGGKSGAGNGAGQHAESDSNASQDLDSQHAATPQVVTAKRRRLVKDGGSNGSGDDDGPEELAAGAAESSPRHYQALQRPSDENAAGSFGAAADVVGSNGAAAAASAGASLAPPSSVSANVGALAAAAAAQAAVVDVNGIATTAMNRLQAWDRVLAAMQSRELNSWSAAMLKLKALGVDESLNALMADCGALAANKAAVLQVAGERVQAAEAAARALEAAIQSEERKVLAANAQVAAAQSALDQARTNSETALSIADQREQQWQTFSSLRPKISSLRESECSLEAILDIGGLEGAERVAAASQLVNVVAELAEASRQLAALRNELVALHIVPADLEAVADSLQVAASNAAAEAQSASGRLLQAQEDRQKVETAATRSTALLQVELAAALTRLAAARSHNAKISSPEFWASIAAVEGARGLEMHLPKWMTLLQKAQTNRESRSKRVDRRAAAVATAKAAFDAACRALNALASHDDPAFTIPAKSNITSRNSHIDQLAENAEAARKELRQLSVDRDLAERELESADTVQLPAQIVAAVEAAQRSLAPARALFEDQEALCSLVDAIAVVKAHLVAGCSSSAGQAGAGAGAGSASS